MARGYEEFATGQLVPTATINDKFIKQGVLYFADAAARDLAITAPEEGMQVYVAANKARYFYNGSAWVFREGWGTGSPEAAVTAGIGAIWHRTDGGAGTSLYVKESGSGNTGWRSILTAGLGTAKGSLISFSADGVPEVLPVGSDDQVPIADSTQDSGIRWGGFPAVGMTREGGNTTEASATSSTPVDILTASTLNIAAAAPLYIVASWRKTAGTGNPRLGLKINATTVLEADQNATAGTGNLHGIVVYEVGPGLANYGAAMGRTSSLTTLLDSNVKASRPAAAVTSVTIRGCETSGGTLFIDDLHVYSLAA